MIRMSSFFWPIAAIDALLFVVLGVMTLRTSAHGDGGREMALFFLVAVPSVVLLVAVLMFAFGHSALVRGFALFVVAVPGLLFVGSRAHDAWIDHVIAENRSGVGYFTGDAMREMGRAVMRRDVATLARLGPSVDVDAVGEQGMTLLGLAVDRDFGRLPDAKDNDELPVVRALLGLGAKADRGLDSAMRQSDTMLLRMLLDAGADPNLTGDGGQPLVFGWIGTITPEALRLLGAHGLDPDGTGYGDPLAVVVTIHRRWDLLAVLIELGADTTRPRPDGRNVAAELAAQADEATKKGGTVPPELARVTALLNDTQPTRSENPTGLKRAVPIIDC